MNKIELLNYQLTETHFIKSYPILSNLKISNFQKSLLELIYSYQVNDQEFYMPYKSVATLLNVSVKTVINNVMKLRDDGFLTIKKKSNWNGLNGDGGRGGSSSTLIINIELVINEINNNMTEAQKKRMEEVMSNIQKSKEAKKEVGATHNQDVKKEELPTTQEQTKDEEEDFDFVESFSTPNSIIIEEKKEEARIKEVNRSGKKPSCWGSQGKRRVSTIELLEQLINKEDDKENLKNLLVDYSHGSFNPLVADLDLFFRLQLKDNIISGEIYNKFRSFGLAA